MGYNHAKNSAYLWCSCYRYWFAVAYFKPHTFRQATFRFQYKDRRYTALYSFWDVYFDKYFFDIITKAVQVMKFAIQLN